MKTTIVVMTKEERGLLDNQQQIPASRYLNSWATAVACCARL